MSYFVQYHIYIFMGHCWEKLGTIDIHDEKPQEKQDVQ